MSRSKRFATHRPHDELSKENAKLTRDISDLENALVLHNRLVDEDHNSVPGLIRKEVGGSRWQYGGDGKLRTFRSKNDLAETKGLQGNKSDRGITPSANRRSPSENVGGGGSAREKMSPRCLNEDAAIQSKALVPASTTPSQAAGRERKPSAKSSSKQRSSRSWSQQQGTWSSGRIAPNSKEYTAVMKNLFGEGGFPLQDKYSVESASVGVSLFAEKDESDLSEMKSKVLKRASAVLIMRPKASSAGQGRNISQQKALPASWNSKLSKGKAPKKLKGTQSERKAIVDKAKSDSVLKVEAHKTGPNHRGRIGSSEETEELGVPVPADKSSCAQNLAVKAASPHNLKDEHSRLSVEHKDSEDDDLSDVLALFNKGNDTKPQLREDSYVKESCYPSTSSVWDKNALRKPWDNWDVLKNTTLTRSKSLNAGKSFSRKQDAGNSRTLGSSAKSGFKSGPQASLGKSWNTSLQKEVVGRSVDRRPKSAGQDSPHRHSWAGKYYSDSERRQQESSGLSTMPPSKQKAVADWLNKHVNSSQEETAQSSPSSSSSSAFETQVGGDGITADGLAHATAKAAGVDSYDHENRVAAWLGSLGLKDVNSYERIFAQHQIDMVDLPSLTVSVLQHIGITKVGPVMKIMRGVERLKDQVSQTTARLRKLEDFDLAGSGRLKGKDEKVSPDIFNFRDVEAGSSQEKNVIGGGDLLCSQDRTAAEEEGNAREGSMARKVDTLRSSLKELYQQLSGEKANRGGEGAIASNSYDTTPFEVGHSECSTNIFHSESNTGGVKRPSASAAQQGRAGTDGTALRQNGEPEAVERESSHIRQASGGSLSKTSQGSADELYGLDPVLALKQDSDLDLKLPEERISHRAPLPKARKASAAFQVEYDKNSAKASKSRSNGSVTKSASKTKSRPASGKGTKGQRDAPQSKSALTRIDTGVSRLAQRLADRQKKREQEEEQMEQRLQKMRHQRDAMAARHKLRERSRSVERELPPETETDYLVELVGRNRRKSIGGVEDTTAIHGYDNGTDLVYHDLEQQGGGHVGKPVSPELSMQIQEMAALLQMPNMDGKLQPEAQGVTLSTVRRLKDKLQHLEQSLAHPNANNPPLLSPSSPAAASAAHPGEPIIYTAAYSGSHGDFAYDLDDLGSPGAEGASGVRTEAWMKRSAADSSKVLDGLNRRSGRAVRSDRDLMVAGSHPRQARGRERELNEGGAWPYSVSQNAFLGQRSPSQGKSKRPSLTQRASSRGADSGRNSGSGGGSRKAFYDRNQNAMTEAHHPVSSEKDSPASPHVVDLALQGVTVGKDGVGQPGEEGGREASSVKPSSTAPHLSMSKRQLLDEIRREKDEHRKNVRHLKSELTRLQHKDPVKKAEIERTDIDINESELIGEGAFCQVFRGQYQGAEVAVKRLKTPLSSQDKNYFAAEVSLLRDLRHPRVVLLVGVSTADRLPIMVLEFMAGRDLYTLIHDSSRPALDHAEFYQIARDVSSGMVYLHNHRPPVLHLDLKSMNVLLTSSHRAKIADFGFSKLKLDADKKAERPAKSREVKGSPAWMAPELLQGGDVTPKADVFSFGVILWEMMSRNRPYDGLSVYQTLERVRTNKRPEILESCPPDLSSLITLCWNQNPAVRPNFKEVLKKVEDMSFPPGWRALFKAAGIPNEALEDLASTRQIISLVSSTLESSTLNSEAAEGKTVTVKTESLTPDTKSASPKKSEKGRKGQHGQNVENAQKGKRLSKRTPRVRESLETCDYCLSDEDTLHLDDSLNSSVHNDSLEEVSPRSRPSSEDLNLTDSLDISLRSSGSTLKFSEKRDGVSEDKNGGRALSLVSSANRLGEVPSLPLESLRSPSPQPVHMSMSSVYDSLDSIGPETFKTSCSDFVTQPRASRRNLAPIVPRLSLGEPSDSSSKKVAESQVPKSCQLPKTDPLSPIQGQPKGDKKDEHFEEKGKCGDEEAPSTSPVMSARQARRLGVSRRSLASGKQPLAASPTDSTPRKSPQQMDSVAASKLTENAEISKESRQSAHGNTVETDSQGEKSVKVNVFVPQVGSNSLEPNVAGDPPQSQQQKGSPQKAVRSGSTPTPKERNSLTLQPRSLRASGPSLFASAEKNRGSSKSIQSFGSETAQKASDRVQTASLDQDEGKREKKASAPKTGPVDPVPPAPPPPPPPPPPLFTPEGPKFSITASSNDQDQRSQALASVHRELLQRSQAVGVTDSVARSMERRAKKKRSFLKERYRGNPHISVEASALLEQKGQLRSAVVPHPNQLQDVPAGGQMFSSMADLLKKAMGQRRFAMGENVGASHSQELTDVSWSLQDD